MRPADNLCGGFGARIRRQQALMLEAARLLRAWGPRREKRQIEMFDERNAA
ncbi:MAG TPA: hypothetical protein VHS58_00150 [Acetobacteraceae bacterium]|nr:hypothetical protein [Acetobacteraceae bacterium]